MADSGNAARPHEPGTDAGQFMQFGKERTDAMLHVQKELFDAYQEAGQAWLNRVKSEVDFWSDLAKKLTASRSLPEGLETYRDSISHRMQMAADDGRRMVEEGQKMIAAITGSMSAGMPKQTKK